jgi:hypothetical protein
MYRRVMYRGLMAVVLAAMVVILVSLLQTPTYEASAKVFDIMNVWRPLGQGLGQVKHGMRCGKIRNLPTTRGRLA